MKSSAIIAVALALLFGCSNPEPAIDIPKSAGETLEGAVDTLKKDVQDAADAAKRKLTEEAGSEIERIFAELEEVAANFNENANSLEGDAKARYEQVRAEFEAKKKIFTDKLAQFKSGSTDAKDDLLKGLYDALSDVKITLDSAHEAFRDTSPPSEQPA
ncbi:MAG: hypothetical protein SGI88_14885 [Candidatus Hydrogenedentes bacterium]|nr:hypothetical protein [Candidatus Hydrogenedentota bacterium]